MSNVVFMGMGEPLLNVERVIAAAEAITDARRFGLGARHVTISTSGVIPGMERLLRDRPQYTLAVSLHAARPALRDVLVPLNRRYPVLDVVRAASDYARMTGRRVSYESVMIDGINDTPADAQAMAQLLSGRSAHVNLIPMNPVAHTPWQPSRAERIAGFRRGPAFGRRDDHHPTQPRHRDRGGLRPAGGRARRHADAGRRPAAAEPTRGGEQRRAGRRGAMNASGPIIAASILTADFGNLFRVVRALEKAGVDRLHLDVMDGHFVPNLTFGPDVVAAIRRLTRLPLDVHLMIDQPAQFMAAFLRAGADSVTFHVEAPETEGVKRESLQRIRDEGRLAGLAISPGTPVASLMPYADRLDIAMVMTVVPGAGGQRFLADEAPQDRRRPAGRRVGGRRRDPRRWRREPGHGRHRGCLRGGCPGRRLRALPARSGHGSRGRPRASALAWAAARRRCRDDDRAATLDASSQPTRRIPCACCSSASLVRP